MVTTDNGTFYELYDEEFSAIGAPLILPFRLFFKRGDKRKCSAASRLSRLSPKYPPPLRICYYQGIQKEQSMVKMTQARLSFITNLVSYCCDCLLKIVTILTVRHLLFFNVLHCCDCSTLAARQCSSLLWLMLYFSNYKALLCSTFTVRHYNCDSSTFTVR